MTRKELLNRHAAGKRDFHGVDLRDVDLQDACLQALSVAHLWDMPEVVRTYLQNANLQNASLQGVNRSIDHD